MAIWKQNLIANGVVVPQMNIDELQTYCPVQPDAHSDGKDGEDGEDGEEGKEGKAFNKSCVPY